MPAVAEADDWGALVNEAGIFASGIGADRWVTFIIRCAPERLTMLWLGPGGGTWHVMSGTREAASETRNLFLEVGFHKSHVKVARLSACREKVAEGRARIDARIAGTVASA
jgi:hypothetical protein